MTIAYSLSSALTAYFRSPLILNYAEYTLYLYKCYMHPCPTHNMLKDIFMKKKILGALIFAGIISMAAGCDDSSKTDETMKQVEEKAEQLKDSGQQKANELEKQASDKASELKDSADKKADELTESAKSKLSEANDKVSEKSQEIKTDAINKADELATDVKNKTEELKSENK